MKELTAKIENGEVKFLIIEGIHELAISKAAEAYAREQAYQQELEKIYSAKELEKRLKVSKTTVYDLVNSGKLRKKDTAKKGYKVTELAVRQYLGDI